MFVTSGWLQAWTETLAAERSLRFVRVRLDGRLVGAAAFAAAGRGVRFAGEGPSDYADVLVDPELVDRDAAAVLDRVLHEALAGARGGRIKLERIPGDSPTLARLAATTLHAVTRQRVEAPRMDMSQSGDVLRKKSLKRHENGLKRRGELTSATYRRSDEVLPRLDAFFDLHVRRWHDTDTPSQFLQESQRAFYRAATQRLQRLEAVRFTEIHLDERLVAAHFGFHWGGRFVWYKPCFDPELARLSPGEVLLKRLIELAVEEGAELFDFTIGGERFKQRFATEAPHVYGAEICRSRAGALMIRAGHRVRELIAARQAPDR